MDIRLILDPKRSDLEALLNRLDAEQTRIVREAQEHAAIERMIATADEHVVFECEECGVSLREHGLCITCRSASRAQLEEMRLAELERRAGCEEPDYD
jgi:predicted RNA-binding Zn-ribbon protein involved in translation (DUF1610 family)